jgi:Reverse transcriptase (RNA-dependent DNA polymerase)
MAVRGHAVRAAFFGLELGLPPAGEGGGALRTELAMALSALPSLTRGVGGVSDAVSTLAANLLDPKARAPVREVARALSGGEGAVPAGLEALGTPALWWALAAAFGEEVPDAQAPAGEPGATWVPLVRTFLEGVALPRRRARSTGDAEGPAASERGGGTEERRKEGEEDAGGAADAIAFGGRVRPRARAGISSPSTPVARPGGPRETPKSSDGTTPVPQGGKEQGVAAPAARAPPPPLRALEARRGPPEEGAERRRRGGGGGEAEDALETQLAAAAARERVLLAALDDLRRASVRPTVSIESPGRAPRGARPVTAAARDALPARPARGAALRGVAAAASGEDEEEEEEGDDGGASLSLAGPMSVRGAASEWDGEGEGEGAAASAPRPAPTPEACLAGRGSDRTFAFYSSSDVYTAASLTLARAFEGFVAAPAPASNSLSALSSAASPTRIPDGLGAAAAAVIIMLQPFRAWRPKASVTLGSSTRTALATDPALVFEESSSAHAWIGFPPSSRVRAYMDAQSAIDTLTRVFLGACRSTAATPTLETVVWNASGGSTSSSARERIVPFWARLPAAPVLAVAIEALRQAQRYAPRFAMDVEAHLSVATATLRRVVDVDGVEHAYVSACTASLMAGIFLAGPPSNGLVRWYLQAEIHPPSFPAPAAHRAAATLGRASAPPSSAHDDVDDGDDADGSGRGGGGGGGGGGKGRRRRGGGAGRGRAELGAALPAPKGGGTSGGQKATAAPPSNDRLDRRTELWRVEGARVPSLSDVAAVHHPRPRDSLVGAAAASAARILPARAPQAAVFADVETPSTASAGAPKARALRAATPPLKPAIPTMESVALVSAASEETEAANPVITISQAGARNALRRLVEPSAVADPHPCPVASDPGALFAALPGNPPTRPRRRSIQDMDGLEVPVVDLLDEEEAALDAVVAVVNTHALAPTTRFPAFRGGTALALLAALEGRAGPWPDHASPLLALAELENGVDLVRFVRPEVLLAEQWSCGGVHDGPAWVRSLVEAGAMPQATPGTIPKSCPRRATGRWASEFPALCARGIVEPYDVHRHGGPCILHPTFTTGGKEWLGPRDPDPANPTSRRNDPILVSEPERLVLDARSINAVLAAPHFAYDAYDVALGAVEQDAYMSVADIKSGYYSILVARGSRRLLGLRGPDGRVYVYTRLPFGLSVAPLLFCAVSATALRIFRAAAARRGIEVRAALFVDDFWLATRSLEEGRKALRLLRAVLATLAMATPDSKVQQPAQRVQYLGFDWRTEGREASVSMTPTFFAKARKALHTLADQAVWRRVSVRGLVSSLRSMLLWVARVYAEGRAFLRGFGRALYAPPWAGRAPLTTRRVLADLRFWARFFATPIAPRPVRRTGRVVRVASDAGEGGLGAVVEADGQAAVVLHAPLRPWMPTDSTSREVFAACCGVKWAAERFGAPLRVTVATDSAAAAFVLTGGSSQHARVSAALAGVARVTWDPGGTLVATWAPRGRTMGMDAVAASPASARRWAAMAGWEMVMLDEGSVDGMARLPEFEDLASWVCALSPSPSPSPPCAGTARADSSGPSPGERGGARAVAAGPPAGPRHDC